MTIDDFRRIALEFPGTSESSHMGHPDFRSNGKIFATLHYPDENWGMVKLPLDQQDNFLQIRPDAFVAAKGAWGLGGSTNVRLAAVDEVTLKYALSLAWNQAAVAKRKAAENRPGAATRR